ncbi:hypothetical protein RIF29_17201 [Crotalaria pallida]|uniref:WRKY domain-containing protein n=1 Tax=Crotalaria pallida TaxID=3830 RepID=A0AAN9IF38_CROPI
MPIQIPNGLIRKRLWRVVGFISSIIGMLSYALSSSFKSLFGEWNLMKIIVYTIISVGISSMILFLKKWKLSRSFLVKAHVAVLVMLLTSLYSFISDKKLNGKPDPLSLISCAAFALMSFCLSRQIDLGFEVDLLNFFLGCLTVQFMEINLMLSIIPSIFCYSLAVLRSKLDSQSEFTTSRMEDHHVTIEVDTTTTTNEVERGADDNRSGFQSDYSNGHQRARSLRRTVDDDDGYSWRKYEEKQVKRSDNLTSYYKCTNPSCYVKKKVESSIDGQVIEILYQGTHTHYKPKLSKKRNSSSEYLYSLLPSEPSSTEITDQSFAVDI